MSASSGCASDGESEEVGDIIREGEEQGDRVGEGKDSKKKNNKKRNNKKKNCREKKKGNEFENESEECARDKDIHNLLPLEGVWKMDLSCSDSYDPVLQKLGFPWWKRKLANRTVPTHRVSFNDALTSMTMVRDVHLVGYSVASSSQTYPLDGSCNELTNDEQSIGNGVTTATAKIVEKGRINVVTSFETMDGTAEETEERYLEDNDTMILEICFYAEEGRKGEARLEKAMAPLRIRRVLRRIGDE